ncbi:MAG TPA: STAS domain-containing protein [Jatrophihabitantaceae bacterium]|nr:STAS domain-containing protein [Jatrophihabitantaceae bacterium]
MDLSLSIRTIGERIVLDVAGEVDVYSSPSLQERISSLIDLTNSSLVVNLSAVTFLDSTGIGTLVAGLNRANQFGGTLLLVTDQERIMKLFRITGLDAVFTIFGTVEEAAHA